MDLAHFAAGSWFMALMRFHNRYPSYLFLKTHFVMYDFDATLGSVPFDEITVMGLFCVLHTLRVESCREFGKKGEK